MKKRIVIAVAAITLVIAIILGIVYTLNKEVVKDYPEIQKEGVIRIVTNIDPIGYFVSSDTLSGYNKEMLTALEAYANLKFEISVESSLEKSFIGLKEGTYDIIARNVAVNADLKNLYRFTKPTIHNKLVLVQRKAQFNNNIAPIRSQLDLANKTIHVPKDSPSIFRLKNLALEIGEEIHIKQDSLYEAIPLIMMVAAGDIDFTLCDIKTAENLSAKMPEIDIKTDIGFTHLEAWAVRSNSPVLLDSLNTWIDRFKNTKQYTSIVRKYYK
ncbi:MAG: hypothetical protein RL662_331 [Bacteroidota bacterium]